ncbi:MAG: response regulator transcription factor [Candidatus Sulfotelmatobacter sp.]
MSPHAQIREDSKIRCVLAHDHVLLRQGLRRLLEDEPDIEVVAEAGNAAEALRTVFEHRPQVVITDVHIFECEPDQSEQLILRESPTSKVLFLTTDEGDNASDSASERPSTHARRQTSAPELVAMVRCTAAAEVTLLREPRRRFPAEWPTDDMLPRQRVLTVRERQVLKLLAEGRTVRSAASMLGLSVKTVDAHKFNLMRKLGIHNKAELVMWAIQKRVVKLPVNL